METKTLNIPFCLTIILSIKKNPQWHLTNLKQNSPQEYVKVSTDYSSVCEAGWLFLVKFIEGVVY